MKKRIYLWHGRKSKKREECPYNFDFIKGCQTGLVIWWNEREFCVDLDKLIPKEATR